MSDSSLRSEPCPCSSLEGHKHGEWIGHGCLCCDMNAPEEDKKSFATWATTLPTTDENWLDGAEAGWNARAEYERRRAAAAPSGDVAGEEE